jgi:hypothetical protein
VPRTGNLLAGAAAVAVATTSALVLSATPAAWADPVVPPNPISALQAPGLPAMQQLSPVIQQAAADPTSAASMLMAAAAAFAGNSATPDSSKQVASSVTNFVQEPAAPAPGPAIPSAQITKLPAAIPGAGVPLPNGILLPGDLNQLLPPGVSIPGMGGGAPAALHTPAAGAIPGTEAHLPTGIDPAHAVGPAPEAAPAAGPAPEAAPAAAPAGDAPPPAAADPAPAPAPPATFAPGSPPTQEFMYPSIGNGCLADGGNVLATALSVAGPAEIPKPGPKAGQTAYVFTAVGTPGPAPEQRLPLNVTWVNLSTGKSGSATLKPNPEINPNGPTTLVAIADTGSGSIMSTIFGQVTTTEKQCQFMPTIGSTVVP